MKDKFVPKEKSITIFINTYKKKAKQPDFTGKIILDGETLLIAMWKAKEGNDIKGKVTVGFEKGVSTGEQFDIVLTVNERKTEDKHPDRVGTVILKGKEYSVGVYKQISKSGLKYLSGKMRENVSEPDDNGNDGETTPPNSDFDF